MSLLSLLQEHAPAASQAGEHAASPEVFAWSTSVSVWTVVIFLILLAVLSKFAFPPILGYAAAREKRIQDTLDEAKHNREEAERLIEQQRQELARARTEAQQVIAEGRQAAEKVRADLLNKARTEQEELLARARADIETERLKAVESVRAQAVDLALAAAGKLIEQRLDGENDRRIINDFLARVDKQDVAGAGR
ncbi:MAG: F0F1 ATP synthase subunit B [Longimicrobiales bacterium]